VDSRLNALQVLYTSLNLILIERSTRRVNGGIRDYVYILVEQDWCI